MKRLASFFSIDTSDIAIVRAQLAAFTKQVPLLYFVLCVNAVLCAVGFANLASPALTLGLPAVLVLICAARVFVWMRTRDQVLTDAQARQRLRGVVVIGAAIGIVFLGWFLALYLASPTSEGRAHVIVAVAVTALGCMTCLMHLRAASRTIAALISLPFASFLLASGDLHYAMIGINLVLVVAALVYVFAVASRDFDRMIRLSAENARLANVDSLTGLPNRRHFFERLRESLQQGALSGQAFAVGVMDIDGFKSVNDVFGHVTGDRLLVEAGRRLQSVAAGRALVARLGGDEFAVIVADARCPEDLRILGERLCAVLHEPFDLPGTIATVSASAGFAVFPVAGGSAELLYERADYALYYAKGHRRGQPVIFSQAHESEIRTQSAVEQALRHADLHRELALHYQPVYDVDTGCPVVLEALARWTSPELGPVSPAVFIPIAERSDLIHRLTHHLLGRALAAAARWPVSVRVSFNLSMRDIVSPESIAHIETIVLDSGIDPARIEFEITESALMADFAQALLSVTRLRALGARIALDDFGTGYSSLSQVHHLPLDKIKVDRSFIVDIESRDSSRAILRTVIDLCSNLDIECVVEGTETERQTEIVRALGCRTMQGYYFARPMPQEAVPDFLRQALPVPQATAA